MIIHFTTVHPRTDTRIRVKEVASLAAALDLPVELFVQDGLGDEWVEEPGFWIRDTGERPKGRLARITIGAWRMFRAVRKAKPKVAHFHDPELMVIAFALKFLGIHVIYDMHENLPKQIQNKTYISPALKYFLGPLISSLEAVAFRIFDASVPAATSIQVRLPEHKAVLLRNYPILDEMLQENPTPGDQRMLAFTYVGGLTRIRGVHEMATAIGLTKHKGSTLHLAGTFQPMELEKTIRDVAQPSRVILHGLVGRKEVAALLNNTRAGLAVLHPTQTHVDGLPTKFFEYMAAGIPIIASDFPVWRKMVDDVGCGLLVDPLDPQAIAQAMDYIVDNPEEAAEMGMRGLRAAKTTYNWHTEVQALIQFYHRNLGIPLATSSLSTNV